MKKMSMMLPLVAAICALAFLSGCATVCGVDKPVTTPPPPKKWVKPVATTPTMPTTYTVEKCDDLWSIAAKPQVYNDPWLWPLLFGANGDKIKDPNKITEGTVLTIPRGVSDADLAAARAKAKKFPKYVPPAGAKRYCPPK